MDTKEAIEFLRNTIYLQNKSDNIITYKRYDSLIKEVIDILKRGEKYEELYKILADSVGIIADDFEQRHFPKAQEIVKE